MSADNYNYIRKRHDGRWDVWPCLFASCDRHELVSDREPRGTFVELEDAVRFADEECSYTEYGNVIERNPDADEPWFLAAVQVVDLIQKLSEADRQRAVKHALDLLDAR